MPRRRRARTASRPPRALTRSRRPGPVPRSPSRTAMAGSPGRRQGCEHRSTRSRPARRWRRRRSRRTRTRVARRSDRRFRRRSTHRCPRCISWRARAAGRSSSRRPPRPGSGSRGGRGAPAGTAPGTSSPWPGRPLCRRPRRRRRAARRPYLGRSRRTLREVVPRCSWGGPFRRERNDVDSPADLRSATPAWHHPDEMIPSRAKQP